MFVFTLKCPAELRRNVWQTVRRVDFQILEVNELERLKFNTTFSTIAILSNMEIFSGPLISLILQHRFKALSFCVAFHVRPAFTTWILWIYSNCKTETCLSRRFRLPLVTNLNHRVLLQAYIDVSECSLRNQLIRNYLENDASLELRER